MKVICIQMDMEFCAADKNYEKAQRLIEKAVKENPDADVLVLPEMWNTGFFPHENLRQLSDVEGERTKSVIGSLAEKYNVNIVAGSVANVKGGKVRNTAYIFSRNGEVVGEYDKTHCFTPMDEDKFFEKGEKLCRFTLDGNACGIIICYDIRFPELTRSLALEGLDFLFVVAQWPDVRIPHLDTLSRARAIENQMFVCTCNSCGKAGSTTYGGNSVIYDPWGERLARADGGGNIISAECDTSILSNIRETINVFRDRRADIYTI